MYANLKKCENVTANTFLNDYMGGTLSEVNDSSVTELPSDLLSNYYNLSRLYLVNCTKIDDFALYSCGGLQEVSAPNCSYIGKSAFTYTGNTWNQYLKLAFPMCEFVDEYAFDNTKFQEVQLGKVGYLGAGVFRYATSMERIYAPNVEVVGSSAFYGCSALKHIDMPKFSVIRGASAFYGCSGSSVMNFGTVELIESSPACFGGLGGYVSSMIFTNLKEIANSPVIFERNDSPKLMEFPKLENIIISANESGPFYSAPIEKLSVPRLNAGSGYFRSMASLKSIYFKPSSKISIGDNAFRDCRNLTTLLNVGPTDLWEIGESAFANCVSLSTIQLENVNVIGSGAFSSCSSIESIEFNMLRTMGYGAFYKCIKLRTVKGTVLSDIPDYAFYNCASLRTVSMKGALNILPHAFEFCNSLETVNLDNTQVIHTSAFNECVNLKYISAPEVTEIHTGAFSKCSSLGYLSLPKCSVFHGAAFAYCDSLETITIDTDFDASDGNVFMRCDSIKTINAPGVSKISVNKNIGVLAQFGMETLSVPNCTVVESRAFMNRIGNKLKNLYLNECIDIGEGAFADNIDTPYMMYTPTNDMKVLDLPKCRSIGPKAFYLKYNGLQKIYLPAIERIGAEAFYMTDPDVDKDVIRTFLLTGPTVCEIESPNEFYRGGGNYNNVAILVTPSLWSAYTERYASYAFASRILSAGTII